MTRCARPRAHQILETTPMKTTTTNQHLGHVAGRTRRVAPSSWRTAPAAFGGRGTTGVDVHPLPVSAYEAMGITTHTTEPAAATVNVCMTNKRPARHLGSSST
jgi:hypothetical protein